MSTPTTTSSDTTATPLLWPRDPDTPPTLPATLAALLSRASSRRGASAMVRETAARQLEERRADWGYSIPVVALDICWNLMFVVASAGMLFLAKSEAPVLPLRVWVCVYAAQCAVHVVLVYVEYRRRRRNVGSGGVGDDVEASYRYAHEYDSSDEEEGVERARVFGNFRNRRSDFAKKCESANTIVSFLWWMVGFYWVVTGGEVLLQSAPRLYWLTVVFLAFDVFFAIFCIVLASLIGIALCCCFPCIIAILYAVAGQEGASDADISVLPRYRFQMGNNEDDKPAAGAGKMVPIATSSRDLASERTVLPEDAECCICLNRYENGTELLSLPCNHNFHSLCVVKWLKTNATCPLCKYNILKGSEEV